MCCRYGGKGDQKRTRKSVKQNAPDTNFRFEERTKFAFSNAYISQTIELYKV